MGGWTGKLLRVNLTDSRISVEDIPTEWMHEYIGGRGLADRYLYEEMDPTVDPLSPENKLIFVKLRSKKIPKTESRVRL